MVLGELGDSLSQALKKLNQKAVIDEEAVEDTIKEIANALVKSDVNVKYVIELKKKVK